MRCSIIKMNSVILLKLLFSFCFIFILSFSSISQTSRHTSLFSVVEEFSDLSEIEKNRLEELKNNPFHKTIHYVRVNNLSHLLKNGYQLELTLPGEKETFFAEAINVNSKKENEYYWYGHIYDDNRKQLGYMSLTSANGGHVGNIVIGELNYILKDLGKRKNVLIKIDRTSARQLYKDKSLGDVSPSNEEPVITNNNEPSLSYQGDPEVCNKIVRILVLHTTSANSAGNPSVDAPAYINGLNQSLRNSGITPAQLTFELAGIEEYDFPDTRSDGTATLNVNGDESGDVDEDIITLQDDGEKANSDLFNLRRNEYDADIVVLLTESIVYYTNSYTFNLFFAGSVFSPDLADGAENAYAIVPINSSQALFPFHRMVAHIFGCANEDDVNPNIPDPNARGHIVKSKKFIFPTSDNTIMNYWGYMPRIPQFSNPNVLFAGKPSGTPTRNNAQRLRNRACAVSDYDPDNDMFINLNGPTTATNTSSNTWTVNVNNCINPTSFVWETSSNGISFNTVPNNNSNTYTGGVYLNTQFTFIRVTVTCSNGQTDTEVYTVRNLSFNPGSNDPLRVKTNNQTLNDIEDASTYPSSKNQENNGLTMKIFPNPVKEKMTIEVFLPQDGFTTISVYNMLGKEVKQILSSTESSGLRQYTINLSDLGAGIYTVVIRQNSTSKTQLISVMK